MNNKKKPVEIYFRSEALPKDLQEQGASKNVACFRANTGALIFVHQQTEQTPFVITVTKNGAQPSVKEIRAAVKEFSAPNAVMAVVFGPEWNLMPGENESYFHVRQIGIVNPPTKEELKDENSTSEQPVSDKNEQQADSVGMEIEGKTFVMPNSEEFKQASKEMLESKDNISTVVENVKTLIGEVDVPETVQELMSKSFNEASMPNIESQAQDNVEKA